MGIVKRWIHILLAGTAVILSIAIYWKSHSQPASAAIARPNLQTETEKPVEGWVVCKDLGVGPVPGLPNTHQRVRLCHQDGWKVDTYCLRPDLPVPLVGATCTRVNEDTYHCGRGVQPLREYNIRETPPAPTAPPTVTQTATPTGTFVPSPTATNLPTQPQPTRIPVPTPAPTRRPSPGGYGFRDLFQLALEKFNQPSNTFQAGEPTPTPFQPLHPTEVIQATQAFQTIPIYPTVLQQAAQDNILRDKDRLHIRIKPDTQRITAGKVIELNLRIAGDCQFEDGTACVNFYQDGRGSEIAFVTVHSGIGGDGQALRNAFEGTGLDQANLTLRQVRQNLRGLLGSPVKISTGEDEKSLTVVAVARIPADQVRAYMKLPVSQALAFASQLDPEFLAAIPGNSSLIVLETCGWRMPGERGGENLPATSASIYIVVLAERVS
jgi:hypothetical protein